MNFPVYKTRGYLLSEIFSHDNGYYPTSTSLVDFNTRCTWAASSFLSPGKMATNVQPNEHYQDRYVRLRTSGQETRNSSHIKSVNSHYTEAGNIPPGSVNFDHDGQCGQLSHRSEEFPSFSFNTHKRKTEISEPISVYCDPVNLSSETLFNFSKPYSNTRNLSFVSQLPRSVFSVLQCDGFRQLNRFPSSSDRNPLHCYCSTCTYFSQQTYLLKQQPNWTAIPEEHKTDGKTLKVFMGTERQTLGTKSKRERRFRKSGNPVSRHECPYCNVRCSNAGQLKGHIRIHTGEKPFACKYPNCTKAFARNEELTRHQRIHTGIKPYICHLCGRKFGRKDHLNKHQMTHSKQTERI